MQSSSASFEVPNIYSHNAVTVPWVCEQILGFSAETPRVSVSDYNHTKVEMVMHMGRSLILLIKKIFLAMMTI